MLPTIHTTKSGWKTLCIVGLVLFTLSHVFAISPDYTTTKDSEVTTTSSTVQKTQREEDLARFSEFLRAKASEVRNEAKGIHLPDIEYEFGDKDGAFVFGYTAYEADTSSGKEKYEHLKFEWHPHQHNNHHMVHRHADGTWHEGGAHHTSNGYIHSEAPARVPVVKDTLIPPKRYRVIRDGEEEYVYSSRQGPVGRALERPVDTVKGWGQSLRDAGSWVTSLFKSNAERMEERASARMHEGSRRLKEKAGDVRHVFEDAAHTVGNRAHRVVEGVADTAHDVYDATRNRIHRTTEGAKHIVEGVASGVRHCAGEIVNGVCKTAHYMEDKACLAGECLKDTARGVSRGIHNAEEAVKEGVVEGVHWVGDKACKAGECLKDTVRGVARGVYNAEEAVKEGLVEGVHWVGDKASAAGHRVVDTLANAKDAVKDKAQGIRCAIGDKLCGHGHENAEQINDLRQRVDQLEHSTTHQHIRRPIPDIEVEVGGPGQGVHVDERVRMHGDHMHIDTTVDLPPRRF